MIQKDFFDSIDPKATFAGIELGQGEFTSVL
jgi:hypothetical protein